MFARSRLRRFAACVLVVWLFSLASGIASACIAGTDSRHAAHEALATATSAHVHHAGMAMDDDAASSATGHEAHHGKPPCERLCDAPAARAPGNELTSVLAGFWLAPAPLPLAAVRLVPARRAPAPATESRWRAAIPLPIALVRLAL